MGNIKLYTVSDRLKQIMRDRTLRQTDILELCEIFCDIFGVKMGRSDLSQYVSGKVEPGQIKLMILAKALNVSEMWLDGFTVPMERDLPRLERRDPKVKKYIADNLERYPNIEERLAPYFEVPASTFLEDVQMGCSEEIIIPENLFGITKRKIPILGNVAAGTPIFADEEHDEYVSDGDDTECDFCLRVQGDSMEPLINDGDIVYVRQQDDVDDGQIGVVLIDDEATLKHIYHIPNGLQLVSKNVGKYPPMVFTFPECDTIRILGRAVAYKRRL